jgi:hypothetical protein
MFEGRLIQAEQVHGAFMAALSSLYARVLSLEEFIQALELRGHHN